MAQTENFTLEIKRSINAPRERVFDAFTIPEQIVKWIGPENGGTELQFRQEGFPTIEDRDGHNDGWNRTLDKFERMFSRAAYSKMGK